MNLGYTTGVFDLFHIGHLNLLRNARAVCDRLVVGVSTDELLWAEKHKRAVIPHHERMEIVRSIRHVDAVIAQDTMDKLAVWDRVRFDTMFVGDDWFDTPRWRELEAAFAERNVRIIYFPYTKGTSSTLINSVLEDRRSRLADNPGRRHTDHAAADAPGGTTTLDAAGVR
jgi:glycerol-3-phosphate cytidylyltransferase